MKMCSMNLQLTPSY